MDFFENTPAQNLRSEVDAVAQANLHGLDGWRLATTGDATEALFLQLQLERAQKLADQRDDNLAIRIANALTPKG